MRVSLDDDLYKLAQDRLIALQNHEDLLRDLSSFRYRAPKQNPEAVASLNRRIARANAERRQAAERAQEDRDLWSEFKKGVTPLRRR